MKELKSVIVRNYNDILNALKAFKKRSKIENIKIVSDVEWSEEIDNKMTKFKATVSSENKDISLYDMLIEGFEQVKEQQKAWKTLYDTLSDDEYASYLPIVDINNFKMPVDKLIMTRLNGKREGLTVIWTLDNKKYVYDPYTEKLDETLNEKI